MIITENMVSWEVVVGDVYELLPVALAAFGIFSTWFVLRGRATPLKDVYNIPVAKVSKLYVYPFKSCHRIELQNSDCTERGLKYDRTFVICDKEGQFLSQRRYPTMATVRPQFVYGTDGNISFALSAPGMEDILVQVPPDDITPTRSIRVWGMVGSCVLVDEDVGAWFSKYLGVKDCSVFYMSAQHNGRYLRTDPEWGINAREDNQSSFNDLSPLLVASEASMELLNSKMSEKLEIERFRPNIILTGCLAHAEDSWSEVCVEGEVVLNRVKMSSRCKMTTVDQEKGEHTSEEPIRTLKKYRLHSMVYGEGSKIPYGDSPLFGCDFGVIKQGKININDTLFIKSL